MKQVLIALCMLACVLFSKGEETITSYLNKVQIGNPVEYKNLRIFPVIVYKTLSSHHYVTLDEAMDKGWLKIKEVGSGQVNHVEVKNNGNEMVFAMTGEIISGAKQDRMLSADILLPAKSGWIQVPVFCVEHGRWIATSSEFKSEKLLVPNALRQTAKVTENQSEIWDEIAASQSRLDIESGTGTIRANYEDEKTRQEIEEYSKRLAKIPQLSKTTIGVVVTTGNRIICFDLFANNQLLRKLWNKLVKSYAMDALSASPGTVDKDDVEEFIESLTQARYISTGTPGLGTLVKIESNEGKGSALIYSSTVVHMDFFPVNGFVDEDDDLRLDLRRDQRLDP